jgi:hypothetical protein
MPEHGPLPKLLMGVPTLLVQPEIPDGPGYRTAEHLVHTAEFVAANDEAGKLQSVMFAARTVALLEGLAVAGLLFIVGRRWFGEMAGLVAAAAWLSTPIVVGFAHVAMIDIPSALATLAVVWALDGFVRAPGDRSAAVVGAVLGGALLCRHSLIVLVAAALVVAVILATEWRTKLRWAALVGLGAWVTVWAFYLVVDPTAPSGAAGDRLAALAATGRSAGAFYRAILLVPWPRPWEAGLGYLSITDEGRPAYLLGQMWEGSRWWFFPVSTVVRTTLPVVLLCIAAPFVLRRSPEDENRRRVLLAGVVPLAFVGAGLLVQPLNLGVRYALPAIALLLVLGAGVVTGWLGRRMVPVLVALLAVQLATFWVQPGSIAATTWGPVGPPGWQIAADVDIGQDALRFDDVAATLEPPPAAALLRALGLPPEHATNLLGRDPSTLRGWVATSAGALTATFADELAWLRAYCPVRVVGDTVLLYRFDDPPSDAPGPATPVGACTDREFSERRD